MSAVQCNKFVRNAWKKELCSNCFKSKEEHAETPSRAAEIKIKLPDPPKHGILRGSKNTKTKSNKVIFPATEFEVIGFGGDDAYSDDEDIPDFREKSTFEEPDTEQDRQLQKLTKSNTDFNSVPSNLQANTITEPVGLGKQLVDDHGKKTTLLVSVTPFGGSTPNVVPKTRTKSTPVQAPEENKTVDNKISDNQPEEEIKPKENGEAVVLENPIIAKIAEVGIKRSQPIDKNSKFRPQKEGNDGVKTCNQTILTPQPDNRIISENKINDKLTTSTKVANLLDKAKKKVNNLPVIGDTHHFKFTSVNSKKGDNNKPVVLDMYKLDDDLLKNGNNFEEGSKVTKITPTIVFETKKSDEIDGTVNVPLTVSNATPVHRSSVLEVKIVDKTNVGGETGGASAIKETDCTDTLVCSNEINAQLTQNMVLCDKLDNYDRIIKDEEVTVFSLEKNLTISDEIKIVDSKCQSRLEECKENVELKKKIDDIQEKEKEKQKEVEEDELPPALPASPPPSVDPQVSFLHQLTGSKQKSREKPKVPAKPVSITSKKPPFRVFSARPKSPSIETFLDSPHQPLSETLSDSAKKRPAPMPPSPKSDGPILRSALSSDNLLNFSRCNESPNGNSPELNATVPRRSLSLSQDCLLDSGVSEMQGKKKSGRGRFSLRKLLHLGKAKDGGKESGRREYRIAAFEGSPSPAPRTKLKPEIIHPLDLTGAQLEVMTPHRVAKTRRSSSSASSSSGEQRESDIPSDSSASQSVSSSSNSTADALVTLERVRKPPPPPRGLTFEQTDKPARPPPPKSISPKRESSRLPSPPKTNENCYANIGEVRSNIAPSKPVRTGSLREIDIAKKLVPLAGNDELYSKIPKHYWTGSLRGPPKCPPIAPPEDSGYESFDVSLTTTSSQTSSLNVEENLYECVQAPEQGNTTPEHSILRNTRQPNYRPDRRSEGNIADPTHDYIKFRFLRSLSMPYCSSEAESEIYSPYSFCGSEMGEEDYEWSPTSGRFQRVSRLKMKKGRSIVHKNLEDNYGAVVVANHEALTQVVEQMHQGLATSPLLRSLISADNLRWSDFAINKEMEGVFVEHRAFYSALWGVHAVTICLAPAQSVGSLHGKPPFNFNPLTELHDLVPACYLTEDNLQDNTPVQCFISVLSRIQIEPMVKYCHTINNNPLTEELKKEIHFNLLQTINAMKTLQAAGIEEAPRELSNAVVCREERDPYPRICMLPSSTTDSSSLCSCLLTTLEAMPRTELSAILKTTLCAEKAVSLSQAKALLEFTLWGPADINFSGGSRGAALQRWLDLERASVLHGLVRTRADLSVFEENHLMFLVHTNAKVLADASVLLDAQTSIS